MPFHDKAETTDADGVDEDLYHRRLLQYQLRRQLRTSIGLNVVLSVIGLILLVTIFLPSISDSHCRTTIRQPAITDVYSPADEAIEYEHRTYLRNDTRFVGYPGPLWEESMHDLLSGTLIRVSGHELESLGATSISLKDGGYAAGLGVAHNLHCVKKLKQWMYREHFYPQLETDSAEFHVLLDHADHCLDFVRQGILCNVDYSLYTLHWEASTDRLLHGYPEKQRCVNWGRLHKWMLSRAASSDLLDKQAL